jgi:hypothetical protein
LAASKAAPNAATESNIGTGASTGLHHIQSSSQPPNASAGQSGEELEQQIEMMFDKADDLMINEEKFHEAVSFNRSNALLLHFFILSNLNQLILTFTMMMVT